MFGRSQWFLPLFFMAQTQRARAEAMPKSGKAKSSLALGGFMAIMGVAPFFIHDWTVLDNLY